MKWDEPGAGLLQCGLWGEARARAALNSRCVAPGEAEEGKATRGYALMINCGLLVHGRCFLFSTFLSLSVSLSLSPINNKY